MQNIWRKDFEVVSYHVEKRKYTLLWTLLELRTEYVLCDRELVDYVTGILISI